MPKGIYLPIFEEIIKKFSPIRNFPPEERINFLPPTPEGFLTVALIEGNEAGNEVISFIYPKKSLVSLRLRTRFGGGGHQNYLKIAMPVLMAVLHYARITSADDLNDERQKNPAK